MFQVGVAWFVAIALITSQYFALIYRAVVVSDFRWLKDNIARMPHFANGVIICLAVALTLGYVQFSLVTPDRQVSQ